MDCRHCSGLMGAPYRLANGTLVVVCLTCNEEEDLLKMQVLEAMRPPAKPIELDELDRYIEQHEDPRITELRRIGKRVVAQRKITELQRVA